MYSAEEIERMTQQNEPGAEQITFCNIWDFVEVEAGRRLQTAWYDIVQRSPTFAAWWSRGGNGLCEQWAGTHACPHSPCISGGLGHSLLHAHRTATHATWAECMQAHTPASRSLSPIPHRPWPVVGHSSKVGDPWYNTHIFSSLIIVKSRRHRMKMRDLEHMEGKVFFHIVRKIPY